MFIIVTHMGQIIVQEGVEDIERSLKQAKEAKSRFIKLTEDTGSKCIINIETIVFCCKQREDPGLVRPPGSAGSA